MDFVIGFVIGAVIGAGIALAVSLARSRQAATQAAQQRQADLQQMREAFASLAGEALDANAKRLSEQHAAVLDGRKALIEQSVKAVNERLEQVRQFIQRSETDRKGDFGKLSEAVTRLSGTAGELHKVLASTQRRGAWGERMAEDVLRLTGMQEDINYVKQSSRFAGGDRERPDFTFFLPNDLKLNMDVKFPLESYRAFLDAETDEQRRRCLGELVKAVRGHVRAVAQRGYVDATIPTVPYVVIFLASEQLYSLVLGAEPDLIDEALSRKVVLASPLTLFAMLAVIRQAAENANVMKTAGEVIALLGQFEDQWQRYCEEIDRL
ncbi:MAG: DNA recombination protein RmuC, partial [Phycisphaerae bacterium]